MKFILDNGGSTIKTGYSGSSAPSQIVQNFTQSASTKKQFRPIERGYLTNVALQLDVWEERGVWQKHKKHTNRESNETSLRNLQIVHTNSPLFSMKSIQTAQNEVFFETLGVKSYMRTSSAEMATFHYTKQTPKSCTLIVESGFSFTHIIPVYQNQIIHSAVRRLNVGGKLLTNYMKEIISYRQFNLMEETQLISQLKERICQVSLNYQQDVKENSLCKQWVLPDFSTVHEGYLVDENNPLPEGDLQVLKLGLECYSVPEVLFHPSDIDLEQAGIPEAIVEAVSNCPDYIQGLLYENIVLIGGNMNFPNIKQRLYNDLRPLTPAEYKVEIFLPTDPILYAWQGASQYAEQMDESVKMVTRKEYEEYGNNICLKRFSC